MKKFRKITNGLAISCFLVLATACNVDDDNNSVPVPETNIIEIAQGNADLTNLVAALERADLTSTLEGSTLYTVMAPTNAAFNTFLSAAGFADIDAVPIATLRNILLNHVVQDRIESALLTNLQKNYLETLAEGPTDNSNLALYFDATNGGVVFNGAVNVTTADIPASNGIIHLVDAVIDFPTLETFIAIDDNFEELDTAIDVVSPSTELDEQLGETGPFTLFAPSNMAFENLLDSNPDWNFSSDIPEGLLISVLAHHVLLGNVRAESISSGETATTLEGDDILFLDIDGNLTITDGSGNDGTAIPVTNIQASNGVIHLIDSVLLPNTEN